MSERKPLTVEKRPVVTPDFWSQESYWIDSDAGSWHSNATDDGNLAGQAEEQWLHRETRPPWKTHPSKLPLTRSNSEH